MKAFVPASDEQIFESSQEQPVPYRVGVPCFHWSAVVETQEGLVRLGTKIDPVSAPGSGQPHRT